MANTTGFYNNSFGLNSLSGNTTGFQNNAFGTGTLSYTSTGSRNSAFGEGALTTNTIGSDNTAMGNLAGYGGGLSGLNSCTFLGSRATATVNGLTNATAIDANASVAVSNGLVLGSSGSVLVGIGTSSPAARLHVVGAVRMEGLATDNTQTKILVAKTDGSLTLRDASTIGAGWLPYC